MKLLVVILNPSGFVHLFSSCHPRYQYFIPTGELPTFRPVIRVSKDTPCLVSTDYYY